MDAIILEAKLRLYGLLLVKENPTEQEVNVMFHLTLDPDVQVEIGNRLKVIIEEEKKE